MIPTEIERLRYRRQYLIAPYAIDSPFFSNHLIISDDIHLYAHVDLNLTCSAADSRKVVLLGDMFDFRNPHYDNQRIIDDLITASYKEFLVRISDYCGRFVLIYQDVSNVYLVTDAASSRKVYYFKHTDGVFCASQPHLIARVLNIGPSQKESRTDFYSSKEFERLHNSNIGNTTCYDNIYQLIPNHYLELSTCKSFRFWPNKRIDTLPLQRVVDTCANMLKGYITGISNRYPIMLPVTSGKDSRLLLSATRDIRDKVYYYVIQRSGQPNNHHDLVIPDRLLKSLNLKFHILHPDLNIDSDFEKIYFENNRHGSSYYLPVIYNYYLNFSDSVNLPGIFAETAVDYFQTINKPVTPSLIAKIIGVERFDYAHEYYKMWLEESEITCKLNSMNILNLLYWEERMPNWGTQVQLDKDIAQDEILPYNSRRLIETMLCAPVEFRIKPEYRLQREITRRLWPETLTEPYNANIKHKILKLSKRLGIMKPTKYIYYTLLKR